MEEEERKISVKKILRHEKCVKATKEAFENRVIPYKIQTIDEFVNAFTRTRNVEKRMPLIVCSKTYFIFVH